MNFITPLLKIGEASQSILGLPRIAKSIIALAVDSSLCILTVWLAFCLRLDEFVSFSGETIWASVVSLALALPVFIISGIYRTIFRYSGFPALLAVARAISVYGLLYATVITAIGIDGVPRTTGLIQPLLLFFAIGSSRALARYWLGGIYQNQLLITSLPKAVIYGAGSAGRQLAWALDNSYEMRVVGFLDDDDRLHGHSLNGHPIFTASNLDKLTKTKGVTHVLLAIPSASRRRRNEILKKMRPHNVAVRTLPRLEDLAGGRVTTSDLRDLDIDDLLGRDAVVPNHALLARTITDKVVLVTGAGGSIGGELCRQIIKLQPTKLVLLEISEYALYAIHSELEGMQGVHPKADTIEIVPLLASVQDQNRIIEIMETFSPDTVYHTAAYKHVPLVEHNLAEGIKNNVFGTLTTARIAIDKGVSDFVLISTDKAVRPTNIMGASKRLAELSLQALYALQIKEPNKIKTTRLSMVRFGNVLDSSGSVIPRFRKQLKDGGPITLTHPEITRYFMTIPEAAQLVIQAAAMATGGEVFVLEMGEPVKIVDLAKRMIELSGLTVCDEKNPDGDIEIAVTGLRPGEKLYEELLLGDNPHPTLHPKIQQAQDPFIPWHLLENDLKKLSMLLGKNNADEIITLLKKLVTGYQPADTIVDWVLTEKKVVKPIQARQSQPVHLRTNRRKVEISPAH